MSSGQVVFDLEFFRKTGSKGGKRCLVTMTPAARKRRARKAVAARWAKTKRRK
jgi:hypothetical protein